jgi:hypothetical protein
MAYFSEKTNLQILNWTHKPVEQFMGINETAIKYTFAIQHVGKETVNFDIVINNTHTNARTGKPFHARVSQRFVIKECLNSEASWLYGMMQEATSLYAQEFYKRRDGTNLIHHKIPVPNFDYYKVTLFLCIADFQKGTNNSRDIDRSYSAN